jgi:hypothetical protein
MIKKIMFMTAKAGFRKLRKEHKSQLRRAAREFKERKVVIPVEPYDLKKKAFKRSFRKTKFMDKAAYLAAPKTKKLPRGGKPTIVGKAFASDKRGKGLQVPMITKRQRKAIQRSISDSVRTFLREKGVKGYKSGSMKTIKVVKSKLEKASKAHAGQAKALGKVLEKKKLLVGGLLTKGIKAAAKKYFKRGNKTQEIVKQFGGTRAHAKADVKSGIKDNIAIKLKDKSLSVAERRAVIRDLNKLR